MRRLLFMMLSMLVVSTQLLAQNRTISGRVTDAQGNGVPNASVTVKGTNFGAVTKSDGSFTLSIPPSARSILVSSVGMIEKEINLTNVDSYDVELTTTSKNDLSEVVVVAYGTQKKADQTGSLVTLKTRDIENIPFTSVDKALQGQVAGLQSSASSGAPGASQTLILRGIGSISASTAPLYVVDGVPINSGDITRLGVTGNTLAGLNPNDIESVTVLKDAASTSIYGSRAANGVILITTRRGHIGKTRVRFDTEMGGSDIAYMNRKARPLNNAEYRELTIEGLINYGFSPAQAPGIADANFYTGTGIDTDWLGLVTRKGKQSQYNLSVDGGNERTQFYISGGFFRQEGVVITSDFRRYNASISASHMINDRMKVTFRLPGSFSKTINPNAGGAFRNPVLSAYFNVPGKNPYNADGTPKITGEFAPGSGIFNPLAIAAYSNRDSRAVQARPSLDFVYDVIKNLKFTSRYGIDYNFIEENQFDSKLHGDGAGVNGRAFAYDTRYFNWTFTNYLDYTHRWLKSSDLTSSVKVGYEAQKSQGYFVSVQGRDFPPSELLQLPSVAATPFTASADKSDYTFNSIFSSLNLNYQDRFVIDGSFRRDGSSRFGANNRFGNFWSVGGAWNMDKEAFLRGITWLSQIKLRASYGTNGNAGIGNYQALPTYGFGANYDGSVGSFPSNIGNPNLTWELNKPFNVGIDLGLFGNRIGLTVEYYNRKTSNLLLNTPISQTSGFPSILKNIGSMENKGVEVTLNATPIRSKNFSWNLNFNLAANKNRILALASGQTEIITFPYIYRVGENFSSFYARRWAGVDPANGDPLWYKDINKPATTNNYSQATRDIIGHADPKVFGGFTNTFNFKGFTLEVQFYYSFGNLLQDSWARYYQGDGFGAGFGKIVSQLDRWKKPGDITDVPKYVYNGNKSSNEYSSRFLYNGGYVRLRNLQLGYNLPESVNKKLHITSSNFYVRGTNLWTYVKDKKLTFDPEQGGNNRTNLDVYIPKTVTIGLNISF